MIRVATDIGAPPPRCFDLARSVDVHVESAAGTRERAIAGVTAGLLSLGDEVTWQARHLGVNQQLASRITAFDRPHRFQDSIVRGAFAHLVHDHVFVATASGPQMANGVRNSGPWNSRAQARRRGEETMEDIAELIAAATAARTRLLDRIRALSTAQGAFKADPAEWSIAENVEHLVLAEQGSINRVWAAADGVRYGQRVWSGEAVHRGKSIERIVAETWAPRQQAPDLATPRRRGPLSYWLVAIRCNEPLLHALPTALAGLDPAEVITPHPVSGPWDARQWLAFVRFHLDLHAQQIECVVRAPGFPR